MRLRPRPPRWWQRATNRVETALYRRTGRSLASARAEVVLLTTIGRTSGLARTNPVSIVEADGGLLIGAGAGGITVDPDWARNLRVTPGCTIRRGRTVLAMVAHEPISAERERLLAVFYERYPFAQRYERWAERPIPLFLLDPSPLG